MDSRKTETIQDAFEHTEERRSEPLTRSEASGQQSVAPSSSFEPQSARDAPGQPIFAQASSVGDSAASVDKLGFELYVNALANFLVAPNTRAPLTCSIEGSWGSGKSSFMLQLKNRLGAVAPGSRTIEFNAWKYDKQEELWAAFALKVTRSLREKLTWFGRLRGDFRLFRTRIKGWNERLSLVALLLMWLLLLVGLGGVITWTLRASQHERVVLIKSLTGSKEKASSATDHKAAEPTIANEAPPLPDPWYNWLSWSPLASSAVLLVLLTGKIPESLRKRLFEAQLEKYIDKPDYKGKAAFVDTFSKDFSKMIAAYGPAGGDKIFVFIDDLDRCEAPKAADLMQAINLMIGDGNSLIFILGLDRAKVSAAIAFKFHKIIPYIDPSADLPARPDSVRSFGDTFLEKFIQLSFRLPISSNDRQARKFIDSLIMDAAVPEENEGAAGKRTSAEAEAAAAAESFRRALRIETGAESQRIRDTVMMVREVLEYSPRRIKTFLNAFRLALYIASAQGLLDIDSRTGEAEITPERLGKFLVLTSRYPELQLILDRDPVFLRRVEQLALEGKPAEGDLAGLWLKRPGVRQLMSIGIVDKTVTASWARQYSMANFPSWKFATILPSIPPPVQPRSDAGGTAAPTDKRAAARKAGTPVSVADTEARMEAPQRAPFSAQNASETFVSSAAGTESFSSNSAPPPSGPVSRFSPPPKWSDFADSPSKDSDRSSRGKKSPVDARSAKKK
jgi:hypothetical protein